MTEARTFVVNVMCDKVERVSCRCLVLNEVVIVGGVEEWVQDSNLIRQKLPLALSQVSSRLSHTFTLISSQSH